MKIHFTKLPTTGGKIQVSLDGGQTFTDYNVEDIRSKGISLDEKQEFNLIQIKSSSEVLTNLDVVKNISVGPGANSDDGGFVVDRTIETFPECVVGIVIPTGMKRLSAQMDSIDVTVN